VVTYLKRDPTWLPCEFHGEPISTAFYTTLHYFMTRIWTVALPRTLMFNPIFEFCFSNPNLWLFYF